MFVLAYKRLESITKFRSFWTLWASVSINMANVVNVYQIVNNLLEIIDDESDDSDEFDMIEDSDDDMEWEYCSTYLNLSFKKEPVPRIKNFVEKYYPKY